jgi:uncharacterized spore protein YtfJ
MTDIESVPKAAVEAASGTVEAAAALLERLADRLGGKASVAAVFGEPIVGDGVTVIPVARAVFGLGGGAGRETGPAKVGGGGGGGAHARPLGFIEIRNGTATYKPIRRHWTDIVIPATLVLAGTLAPRLARAIGRRRR